MASETVPGVRAKLARAAQQQHARKSPASRLTPGTIAPRRRAPPSRSGPIPRAMRCSPISAAPRCRTATCWPARPTRTCSRAWPRAYADDAAHAQRALRLHVAAVVHAGDARCSPTAAPTRGLPISCFLNSVEDNLDGIVGTWTENVWLASNGGGIGTYWGGVRSIGETVKGCGQTSGIIPFVRVMDSLTLAISQGSLRRGSAAVYLDVHHPEIEEFIEIRKPSGDFNRKSLNLHHGICITDEFMDAVRDDRRSRCAAPRTATQLRSRSTPARCGRRSSRPGCRPASPTCSSATRRTASWPRTSANSASRCASRISAARSCCPPARITSDARAPRCAACRR